VQGAITYCRGLSVGLYASGVLIPLFLVRPKVDKTAFKEAWKLFPKYAGRGLSYKLINRKSENQR